MRAAGLTLLAACLLTGCGAHGGGGKLPASLGTLSLSPVDQTVTLAPGVSQDVTYAAALTDSEGRVSAVPASYTATGDPIGILAGDTFHIDGTRAGVMTITAAYQGLTASATLTVALNQLVVTLDGLPASIVPTAAAGTETAALNPTWVYPAAASLLPPNLYGVQLTWTAAPGTDTYLVELTNAGGRVQVLTAHPYLLLDHPTWDQLTTVLGSGAFDTKVIAFAQVNPAAIGTATRSFRFSKGTLDGTLYYWSSANGYETPYGSASDDTMGLRGYFRYDFTAATDANAQLFLGFERAGNQCVGCHALSQDGTRFATSFDGDTHWGVFDVASSADPIQFDIGGSSTAGATGNFSAFSPDADTLFVTDNTAINVFDLTTLGVVAPIASFATAPYTLEATQLSVSPVDGSRIIYVEEGESSTGTDTSIHRGRLVSLSWDATHKTLGNRQVLLDDPSDTYSYFYPAISPDGKWVLFARGAVGAGYTSYDNTAAEVWVMSLDTAGAQPMELAAADQGPNLTNSWPRWAPFKGDDGEGHARYFVTFSSTRTYLGNGGVHPQLWLSSFDPSATADPSSPALWLPVQNFSTGNHAAQWTQVYVPIL